jgi:hypothetical protein
MLVFRLENGLHHGRIWGHGNDYYLWSIAHNRLYAELGIKPIRCHDPSKRHRRLIDAYQSGVIELDDLKE